MGSGFPAQYPIGGVGTFNTPSLVLPQTADKVIFTAVSRAPASLGYVEIVDIMGLITTTVGAVANATKLKVKVLSPAGLAFVDLCATVDINAFAAGRTLSITGTLATAMASNANGVQIAQVTPVHIAFTGNMEIRVDCAGNDGSVGRVSWHMAARASYGVLIKPAQS